MKLLFKYLQKIHAVAWDNLVMDKTLHIWLISYKNKLFAHS